MKRMKRVQDPNMIRAQGIVGVGASTRTFTFLFLAAGSRWTVKAG
jgi:hypothetical protein